MTSISPSLSAWLSLKPDLDAIIERHAAEPDLVGHLLDILDTGSGSRRFQCDRIVQKLSESRPDWVYPAFDRIAGHITDLNHFIQWGALLTLSHLIQIDTGIKFMNVYPVYLALADGDSMITASNAAKGLCALIPFHPELETEIVHHLIGCENRTYLNKGKASPECANIMIAHVLECFAALDPRSSCQHEIRDFVSRHRDNPRPATARKANAFLKQL